MTGFVHSSSGAEPTRHHRYLRAQSAANLAAQRVLWEGGEALRQDYVQKRIEADRLARDIVGDPIGGVVIGPDGRWTLMFFA